MNLVTRKSIVVRVLFIVLIASWAGGMGCTSRVESVVEEPSATAESTKPEPMDNQERAKELAKLTAKAYREAQRFSYKLDVTYGVPQKHIQCKVVNGCDNLNHLCVYDEQGQLFYELHVWPDPGGVLIREDNYRGDESEEYVATPADYKVGKWRMHCTKGVNGCTFGGQLRSWIGPDSYRAAFLEEILPDGEYVGTERVNGYPCDIVETHRVKGLIERIYIDQKTYLVRRWFYDYKGVITDRVFANIKISYDETSKSAKPEPVNTQERAKKLAKLTAQAYREAWHLSYEEDVTYGFPPEKIRCVTDQRRKNRHHLWIYDAEGQLFYELESWPDIKGVKIEEKNYRGDESQVYVVSLPDFEPGKWDPRCMKDITGCAFGTQLRSWVGPHSQHASFWENTIAIGECVGTEDVNGYPCDIVETHRVKGLIERIYIDQKTYLVRRWFYDYKGVITDRVFANIKISYDVEKSAH